MHGAGSVGATLPATPEVVAVTGTYDAIILYADNNTPGANGSPIAWATHTQGEAELGHAGRTAERDRHHGRRRSEKMAALALNGTSIILSFRSNGRRPSTRSAPSVARA